MRPLTFTAFPQRSVTVNPRSVSRVEIASPASAKRHAVVLVFAGSSDDSGERSMPVAEFKDLEVAKRLSKRIGEHLWSDDAPALDAQEERLIADNPATHDGTRAAGSVPVNESNHPALRYERDRRKRAAPGPARP